MWQNIIYVHPYFNTSITKAQDQINVWRSYLSHQKYSTNKKPHTFFEFSVDFSAEKNFKYKNPKK